MRMRKKKHLSERMEKCESLIVPIKYDELNFDAPVSENLEIDFKELFGNDNPVFLEVGCGKGAFIAEIASREPLHNFLAVEKEGNVMVLGCEKVIERSLSNVRFVKLSAEYLWRYIPKKSIDGIYLNFSCPFPKKAYRNHRLTSPRFLKIYKDILKDGAEIHQKTDNMHFFEYSIEQFTQNGFCLKNISLDLHNSDFEGNIVTEYEKRFSDLGQPIYRLEAYIKGDEELE